MPRDIPVLKLIGKRPTQSEQDTMRLSPTLLLLPLLTLFPPTSSVDVSFYSEGPLTVIDGFVHGRGPGTWTITCANLLPGQCCRLPGPSWITSRSTKGVTFTNLGANHIAAVWVRNRDMGLPGPSHGDCNDVVHRSSAGPGTWRWFDWMRRVDVPHGFQIVPVHATGGSYIQMPVRLPPDTGTANWLEAEGLYVYVERCLLTFAKSTQLVTHIDAVHVS